MDGAVVPVPPGCARLIDSNGEGDTFWQVQNLFRRASLKDKFPEANTFSLQVRSDNERVNLPSRGGITLREGETYIVPVPSKHQQEGTTETQVPKHDVQSTAETPGPNEEAKCGICLETIVEQGVMDACKHDFCFSCILKWSKVTNTCPMCKAEFRTIERKTSGSVPTVSAAGSVDSQPRRSRRLRKDPPSVVTVQPKKQKYEYTRQELEQIAGIHEEEQGRGIPYHFPHPVPLHPFLFGGGMGGLSSMGLMHQFLLQAGLPPSLAHLAQGHMFPPHIHNAAVHPALEEDEEEVAWFDEEDDSEDEDSDSVPTMGDAEEVPVPPRRGTASRATWFTPTPGGSRARLRQLMEMPSEERNEQRRNNRRTLQFVRASQIPSRSQPDFQGNLATLKGMFSPTFDDEILQTVLEQVGNNVSSAVDALLEMQSPPSLQGSAGEESQANDRDIVNADVQRMKDEVVVLSDGEGKTEPARDAKRKFEWPKERESTMQDQDVTQEKRDADGRNTEPANSAKRRRVLRRSFGEMSWEEKEGEKESGATADRMEQDEEPDMELIELAWKDYDSLQKRQEKRDALRNNQPRRARTNAVLRSDREPMVTIEESPNRNEPGAASSAPAIASPPVLRGPGSTSGDARGVIPTRFGLPPHLRNSAGARGNAK